MTRVYNRPEPSAQADYHAPGDYPVTRQRSWHERMHIPVEKSAPPLRTWGPHILAAALGVPLVVLLAFLLFAIN